MKGVVDTDDVSDGFDARTGTWTAGKYDVSNGFDVWIITWTVCVTLGSWVLAPLW